MRSKMFGAFTLGFAAGALLLTVALWYSGVLDSKNVIAGNLPTIPCEPSHAVPAVAIATVPASGPSDGAPEPVAMPIAGISASSLSDTFNETHNGHKHEALDIMAPRGTPVMAAVEGNVAKLFKSEEGGLTVYQFDNRSAYSYYYAHLDHYVAGLTEGTLLRQGQILGYVGSTGNASADAPHLHFAIFKLNPDKKWWEGTPVNPLPLLR